MNIQQLGAQWGPILYPQSKAQLASLSVNGLTGGQPAQTLDTGEVFILQKAISSTPDGVLVIATADDGTKQWALQGLQDQGWLAYTSPEIDMTVVKNYVLVPPLTSMHLIWSRFPSWLTTFRDGTITSPPTTNSGIVTSTDVTTSTSATNLSTQVANAISNMQSAGAAPYGLDLTANGYVLQVTVGAVLGTASALRCRAVFNANVARY